MVSTVHASYHNVNMIIVTKINTNKADTEILMMHENIKYNNTIM